MLASSVFILSLAAIGSSFTLPAGLSNGLYKAYYNAAGESVYELVTTDTTSLPPALPERGYSRSKGQAVAKRWNSLQTWCGCANPMNAGDTNVANAGLANWAASSPVLGGDTAEFVIQNTAVAFVCNYDGGSVNVPSNLVSNNAPDISYACGNFIAGTSQLEGFAHFDYGYMNYFSGLNMCENAESAPAETCPNSAAGSCDCLCVDACQTDCENGFTGIAEAACYASCVNTCGCGQNQSCTV